MGIRDLSPSWRARLAVLGLMLLVAALQHTPAFPFVAPLPFLAILLFAFTPARRRARSLMNAPKVSWKSTLALVLAFGIALVAAGHGVMPVALFLVYGWERYVVGTTLAWIAILVLGSSPWIPMRAPRLGFLGALLAFAAWVLFQSASDEPLAGVLGSLPFLVCFALHVTHLWRVRAPARLAGTSSSG